MAIVANSLLSRWGYRMVRAVTAALLMAIAVLGALPSEKALAEGTSAATILIYHRFGEPAYPATSVTMEQFKAHLAELTSGKYTVLPLPEVIDAIRSGQPLPGRTVVLTVDDAFRSLYDNAWPLLKEAGIPFTVFVATQSIDQRQADYMTWDELREMKEAGVTIGSQAVTHPHMAALRPARNQRELTLSAQRLTEELGTPPAYFAYPYGETSAEVIRLTMDAGYEAAFGQHSGAANQTSPLYYLPRFPVNVNFGGIERFRRILNSLPLPISDLSPSDPFLVDEPGTNPPAFGFTIGEGVGRIDELACYHSDAGRIETMDLLGRRVEVRFDRAFAAGRTRINCTVPAGQGRWRWFGMQYYVKP